MLSGLFTVLLLSNILAPSTAIPPNFPLQSLSQGKNLTFSPSHCTHAPEWTNHDFNPDHCTIALNDFLARNVSRYTERAFEFVARGTIPMHTLPTMPTPLKTTAYTCTLVIAMLDSFPRGSLPGVIPRPYYPTDVESFTGIYASASRLRIECTGHRTLPGWISTGGRGSIGVFFWATHSEQNTHLGRVLDRLPHFSG